MRGPRTCRGPDAPALALGASLRRVATPSSQPAAPRSRAASGLLVRAHHPPSLTSATSCVLGPPELGGAQPCVRRRGRRPAALGTVGFTGGRVSMLHRARAVCPTEAYHLWPRGLCSWSQRAAQPGRRQRLAAEIPEAECWADLASTHRSPAAGGSLVGAGRSRVCARSPLCWLPHGAEVYPEWSSWSSSSPGGKQLVDSGSLEFPWVVGEAL